MTSTPPQAQPGRTALVLARGSVAVGGLALVTAALASLLSLVPFASLRWSDGADVGALSQSAPRALLSAWLVLAGAGAAVLLGRTSKTGRSLLTAGGLLTAMAVLATGLVGFEGLSDAALPERLAGAWTVALWGLALRVAHGLGARPSPLGISALLLIACARQALAPLANAPPSSSPWPNGLLVTLEIVEGLTLIALVTPALASRPAEQPAQLLLSGAMTWLLCSLGLTLLDALGNPLGSPLDPGPALGVARGAGAHTLIVAAALAQVAQPALASNVSLGRRVNLARSASTAGLCALVTLLIAACSLEQLVIQRDGLAPLTARVLARPLWIGTLFAGVLAAVGLTMLVTTVVRGALSGRRLAAGPTPGTTNAEQTSPADAAPVLPPTHGTSTHSAGSQYRGAALTLLRAVILLTPALALPAWLATRPPALPAELLALLPASDSDESSETLRRGRDVFVREGCWSCHVAPLGVVPGAPDLLVSGSRRSAGWQRMHLFDPGLARAWSTMPASPQLFLVRDADGDNAAAVAFDGLTFDGGGDATLELLDEGLVPVASADAEALVTWLLWLQQRPARRDIDDPGLAALGEHWFGPDDLFRVFCSSCHGTEGNGDGPAAVFLDGESLPRHLRKGLYRVRSHPELPTDDDLLRTLTRGMPGTAMPGFPQLSEDDRVALVDYVKRLARQRLPDGTLEDPFTVDGPIVALPMPPAPAVDDELLARGAELLQLLDCARCHGEQLTGMTAQQGGFSDWVDEAGRPLPRSHNLLSDPFKGGDAPADVYRTLFVGQGGSPMPSYAEALPASDDRWALVLHLGALRQAARLRH